MGQGVTVNNPAAFGAASALMAALLFGLSAPLTKLLLANIQPVTLAALLYLGSWLGLFAFTVLSGRNRTGKEARLTRGDLACLAGSILCGGIGAPVFLVYGLAATTGSVASLLLNVEGILTTMLAAVVFREAVGGRVWAAAFVMLAASLLLSYSPSARSWAFEPGAIMVLLSSLMWSIDNNLTRRLSHRDPYAIARYKGLFAGLILLFIASFLRERLPGFAASAGAMGVGMVCYGASLVFFIYALRHLGTSRTITFFGAAPFIGMAFSIVLLGDRVTLKLAAAAALMFAGLLLILRESHSHEHTHGPLTHEHSHVHDDHHAHPHPEDHGPEPHCHEHEHCPVTHSHAHAPDLHHYHEH